MGMGPAWHLQNLKNKPQISALHLTKLLKIVIMLIYLVHGIKYYFIIDFIQIRLPANCLYSILLFPDILIFRKKKLCTTIFRA